MLSGLGPPRSASRVLALAPIGSSSGDEADELINGKTRREDFHLESQLDDDVPIEKPLCPSSLKMKAMLAILWGACFGLGSAIGLLYEKYDSSYEPGQSLGVRQAWEGRHTPWAFMTMAVDAPQDQAARPSLWQALALAQSLQQFTAYRIVVLTDYETFPDGTSVAEVFGKLAVEIRPSGTSMDPEVQGMPFEDRSSFYKFEAWSQVDLEKVVWLDGNAIVSRSLDWLFKREGMWGGSHNWSCKLDHPDLNSGILTLTPSLDDANALGVLASQRPDLDVHQVLSQHFSSKRQPIRLLSELDSGFGRCLDAARPSPYLSSGGERTNGIFNLPSFVQQSGGFGQWAGDTRDNICFSIDVKKQVHMVGSVALNICHFHPLGAHWRSMLCKGVAAAGVQDPSALAFCHDQCFYGGRADPLSGRACPFGPVDSTPNMKEYYERSSRLARVPPA